MLMYVQESFMEKNRFFKFLLFINVLFMVLNFALGFTNEVFIFNPFLTDTGLMFILTIFATSIVYLPNKPYPILTLGLFGFISAFFLRGLLISNTFLIFNLINLITTLIITIALTAKVILAYYGYSLSLLDKEKSKGSDK